MTVRRWELSTPDIEASLVEFNPIDGVVDLDKDRTV